MQSTNYYRSYIIFFLDYYGNHHYFLFFNIFDCQYDNDSITFITVFITLYIYLSYFFKRHKENH